MQRLPNENSLYLDNTGRTTADNCLRKYFLRHILDLIPDNGSSALRYGTCWHSCMEAFYGHIKEHGWTKDGAAIMAGVAAAKKSWDEETMKHVSWWEDYRTLENLQVAFLRYVDNFVADENHLEVISTEEPFKLPMVLTAEEQRRFPYLNPFWFTGITDMEIHYDGRYWQLDHKTTGQSLSIQVQRLNRSAQSKGYCYAGKVLFKEPPEGHFISVHYLSAYKSKKTGLYGDPKIEFQRVPMMYTEEDLASWRMGFLEAAQRLQIAKENDTFPCNDNSCYTYGRCSYSDICDMNYSEEDLRKRVTSLQGFQGFHVGEHWNPAKNL